MNGARRQGLDYAVIPATLNMLGVPRGERHELFKDLRLMERAALEVFRKGQS